MNRRIDRKELAHRTPEALSVGFIPIRQGRCRGKRGVSLVELMMALAIMGLILPAAGTALLIGMSFRRVSEATTASAMADYKLQDTVRRLLSNAVLSADIADQNTYFILEQSSGSQTDLGYSLVFTSLADPFKGAALDSQDDFETLNEKYGPEGGYQEVSLSLTPVGQVGDATGLFLRRQRPADSDPTQGGRESLLDPDVQSITFECFDGQAWEQTWDTRSGARRLPAAVRVTYRLTEDPETDRQFVVRLRFSDVTPDNPVSTSTGSLTP